MRQHNQTFILSEDRPVLFARNKMSGKTNRMLPLPSQLRNGRLVASFPGIVSQITRPGRAQGPVHARARFGNIRVGFASGRDVQMLIAKATGPLLADVFGTSSQMALVFRRMDEMRQSWRTLIRSSAPWTEASKNSSKLCRRQGWRKQFTVQLREALRSVAKSPT